ncbi:MAG: hypothetical protein JHD07_15390 [Bradyrhizobium sp.]|jgi:hypothetical protein|uniref:hypothetical protein n=1 Tax=Bradyrhizobium sp. TaxID=376 RepID=UPI001A28E5AC|nr:hypothetical protein [Bradyrhizobium sp.]MBJ7404600.1 hypothetical protein [Bradyrhizobium sp.]
MQRSKPNKTSLAPSPESTRESLDVAYAQVVRLRQEIVEAQAALKPEAITRSAPKELRT